MKTMFDEVELPTFPSGTILSIEQACAEAVKYMLAVIEIPYAINDDEEFRGYTRDICEHVMKYMEFDEGTKYSNEIRGDIMYAIMMDAYHVYKY